MKKIVLAVAVVCLLVAANSTLATTQTYTDETAFKNAISPDYYLEDFNALTPRGALGSSLSESSGGYSYSITAGGDVLVAVPYAVTTNNSGSTLLVTFTGKAVTAVGGFFYAHNGFGTYTGEVTVTLSNGFQETLGTSATDFEGFITDSPIATIGIQSVNGLNLGDPQWPLMDHFYVGEARTVDAPATVPEPISMIFFGTGLVAVGGFIARRRMQKQA